MQSLARDGYTEQEVKDVLHGRFGGRALRFKYKLLDKDENEKGELSTVMSGEVSMSQLDTIKRTASFKIKDDDTIDWLADRIQPIVEVKMPTKVGDAVAPVFTRNSVANQSNGKQVSANQPRFENGKFGQGLMIEEGTTNQLISADMETWTAYISSAATGSATFRQDPIYGKVMQLSKTDNASGRYGRSRALGGMSGSIYTPSVWVRPLSGTGRIALYVDASKTGGSYITQGIYKNIGTDLPLNQWTRISLPMDGSPSTLAGGGSAYLWIDTAEGVVEFAMPQVELKKYATSFINGTRAAEALPIVTNGVIDKNEGTIELKINPTIMQNYNQFFSMGVSTGRFLLYWESNGNIYWDYGAANSGINASATGKGVVGQFVDVKMRWSKKAGTYQLFVNGIKAGSKLFTAPTSLPTTVNVVNNFGAIVDDLRISNVARTDDEITKSYNSNAPLPVDKDTTFKMDFNGSLSAKNFVPSQYIEFPLGIFLLKSPKEKDEDGMVTRDVEAYDGLQVLSDDKFLARYVITAGTNYKQAMVDLLATSGITKYNIEDTDKVIPVDIEYAIGDEKIKAFNDLAGAINFIPCVVDPYGYYTSYLYKSPDSRSIDYSYVDDHLSVTYNGMTKELDTWDIPNKWVAVISDPERTPMISIYENSNPDSPTSTVNLGRSVVRVLTDGLENIADQNALDSYVQRIAFEASQVYGKLEFETAIMPQHDYADLLNITYSRLGIANENYVETGWTLPLETGGKMKHEVRKVVQI